MRAWSGGLALRLILFLGIPVAGVEIAFGILSSQVQEEELLDEVVRGASQLSSSITSATWHAMRADRRADAYEVIGTMGRRNGIDRIRLFDNQGRIAYSTVEEPVTRVGKESETCALCHVRGKPLVRMEEPRRSRIISGAEGTRQLGIVTAIYNEPACSQAACHAHPADTAVLGVLDVTVSLAAVDDQIRDAKGRVLLLSLVNMGILTAVILVTNHFLVARPIRRLKEATRAISEMELDRPVEVPGGTEISALAGDVDLMRLRLRGAVSELDAARRDLEAKVEERGRRLRDAERRLVRNDRLASLGRLAGIVAHEVNNPVSAVHTFSKAMQRILGDGGIPPGRENEFRGYLAQVSRETARVGGIVSNLLAFSRRASPQFTETDVNLVVRRTVDLVRHKLDMMKVRAVLELDEGLPPTTCDPSQLEQVALNLLLNGAESMPGGGSVRLRTFPGNGGATTCLSIEDEGVGIPEEHLSRIFDPFFSTKSSGRGVGLGLAVVYGIVNAHGGTVDVSSAVGKGTTFLVSLPVQGPPRAEALEENPGGGEA